MKKIILLLAMMALSLPEANADVEIDEVNVVVTGAGAAAATDLSLSYRKFYAERGVINAESEARRTEIRAKTAELLEARVRLAPEAYRLMNDSERFRVRQIEISQQVVSEFKGLGPKAQREIVEVRLERELGPIYHQFKHLNYGELVRLQDAAHKEFYGKSGADSHVSKLRLELDALEGRDFSQGPMRWTPEAMARGAHAEAVDRALKRSLLRSLAAVGGAGYLWWEYGSDHLYPVRFERNFHPKRPPAGSGNAPASHPASAQNEDAR